MYEGKKSTVCLTVGPLYLCSVFLSGLEILFSLPFISVGNDHNVACTAFTAVIFPSDATQFCYF